MSDSLPGTPTEVRDQIVYELTQRLVGPAQSDELLENSPWHAYHTGRLSPLETPLEGEADDQDVPDSSQEKGAADGIMALANMSQQSAMGMSFQLDPKVADADVRITASWGEYNAVEVAENDERPRYHWQRSPCSQEISLPVNGPVEMNGISLEVEDRVTSSDRILTVSILNRRVRPSERSNPPVDLSIYQVELLVESVSGEPVFVARPASTKIRDEEFWNNELLYRSRQEIAVGHGCSVDWETDDGRRAQRIRSQWLPRVEVPKASTEILGGCEFLELDLLADRMQRQSVCSHLCQLTDEYRKWVNQLESRTTEVSDQFPVEYRDRVLDVCNSNIQDCHKVSDRIQEGIEFLRQDDDAWAAFCLANQAMAENMRVSRPDQPPRWRAFQIAFILVCLKSTLLGEHRDRKTLELIWFPTGGGKTEAYLGLAAIVLFHRRLKDESSDGTDILTRYTLRLLTIQQFERAARLICACEVVRRGQPDLGNGPFTCGLYVGGGATPNTLDEAAEILNEEADSSATTLPLVECPWCEAELRLSDQRIDRTSKKLLTPCSNEECEFHTGLPIAVVDEEIFGHPSTMVVGTIDKFARMAWEPGVKSLFDPAGGHSPNLIIQDELHLIADALGTVSALYETAIDYLCTRDNVPPKLIGSTATIRRAGDQCRCLFDRTAAQFPPSGLDIDDSFFYRPDNVNPGRYYVGVHAQGQSPKHTLVWTIGELAQSVTAHKIPDEKLRDPFHTMVLYFNSIRELGGAWVLAEDHVPRFIRSIEPEESRQRRLFNRQELTGQVPSTEIKKMLRGLQKSLFDDDLDREPLDLVFSTNMISVGIDVDRLGVMIVNGQPKTTADYIQATSRVGRPADSAGLIVTLYHWTRPRDRSHYERFRVYHESFYRMVESVSVTPFSARARDRALHAVLVAMARILVPELSEKGDAGNICDDENILSTVKSFADVIVERSKTIDPEEAEATRRQIDNVIEEWVSLAKEKREGLVWSKGPRPKSSKKALLGNPGLGRQSAQWSTLHSMRDVQLPTPVKILSKRELDSQE